MLQQTQIATVIPYYQRFLKTFPTVQDLAGAPLERVLAFWSGLGYYRRARHLHQAAKLVLTKFAGRFPEDYASLRALPGIGDYTAKAVLSIAFGQPFAVLDGNVARVVARLFARRGNLHQPVFRRSVEAELAGLLSHCRPGDFNEALMELGQTTCLPRWPLCSTCPLAKWCRGFRSGDPEAFPLPRPRRAAESHYLAAALLRHGTRVALVRGLDDGLLADLWNFPAAFGATPAEAREALREKLRRFTGASFSLGKPAAEFRHTITYRTIEGRLYPVGGFRSSESTLPSPPGGRRVGGTEATRSKHAGGLKIPPQRTALRWFQLARLPQAAISQLARKILHRVIG
jgi:A/G-specific adenine glycosylase